MGHLHLMLLMVMNPNFLSKTGPLAPGDQRWVRLSKEYWLSSTTSLSLVDVHHQRASADRTAYGTLLRLGRVFDSLPKLPPRRLQQASLEPRSFSWWHCATHQSQTPLALLQALARQLRTHGPALRWWVGQPSRSIASQPHILLELGAVKAQAM